MITSTSDYSKWFSSIGSNKIQVDESDAAGGEEYFVIDLNTRTIEVPESFNSAIVENDINSETIYFKVNRYYDNQDLKQANVVVQYINADGEDCYDLIEASKIQTADIDETTEYISSSSSASEYLYIPWTIGYNVAKSAGTVTFALKFYINQDASEETKTSTHQYDTVYSLNTAPATFNIQEGLDTSEDAVTSAQYISIHSNIENIIQNWKDQTDDIIADVVASEGLENRVKTIVSENVQSSIDTSLADVDTKFSDINTNIIAINDNLTNNYLTKTQLDDDLSGYATFAEVFGTTEDQAAMNLGYPTTLPTVNNWISSVGDLTKIGTIPTSIFLSWANEPNQVTVMNAEDAEAFILSGKGYKLSVDSFLTTLLATSTDIIESTEISNSLTVDQDDSDNESCKFDLTTKESVKATLSTITVSDDKITDESTTNKNASNLTTIRKNPAVYTLVKENLLDHYIRITEADGSDTIEYDNQILKIIYMPDTYTLNTEVETEEKDNQVYLYKITQDDFVKNEDPVSDTVIGYLKQLDELQRESMLDTISQNNANINQSVEDSLSAMNASIGTIPTAADGSTQTLVTYVNSQIADAKDTRVDTLIGSDTDKSVKQIIADSVDENLSSTSTNAVQNKTLYAKLAELETKISGIAFTPIAIQEFEIATPGQYTSTSTQVTFTWNTSPLFSTYESGTYTITDSNGYSYSESQYYTQDTTFTLTVHGKGDSDVATATTQLIFCSPIYYGAATEANFDYTSLASQLNGKTAKASYPEVTVSENQYYWFAIPTEYDTGLVFTAGGFSGGFQKTGTSADLKYNIYRSDYSNLGKQIVTIS